MTQEPGPTKGGEMERRWDAYHVQLASDAIRDGRLLESIDRESLADDLARIAQLLRSMPIEGERIEGWVPNWEIPDGGAMLRGIMKPVPLSDRGCEFYAGPKPFTQDSWTPASLIIHITSPRGGESE